MSHVSSGLSIEINLIYNLERLTFIFLVVNLRLQQEDKAKA